VSPRKPPSSWRKHVTGDLVFAVLFAIAVATDYGRFNSRLGSIRDSPILCCLRNFNKAWIMRTLCLRRSLAGDG
jgi:hypothetical protein